MLQLWTQLMLREGLIVLVVGTVIGLGLGAVRGFPSVTKKEVTGVCESPVPSQPDIVWIHQKEARELFGKPSITFVDARSSAQYRAGHISGALHAPVDDGTVDHAVVEMLRSFATVIAYCDTSSDCARSSRLAALLAQAGIPNVRVLEGGMPKWLANGYPAEAGSCHRCPSSNTGSSDDAASSDATTSDAGERDAESKTESAASDPEAPVDPES